AANFPPPPGFMLLAMTSSLLREKRNFFDLTLRGILDRPAQLSESYDFVAVLSKGFEKIGRPRGGAGRRSLPDALDQGRVDKADRLQAAAVALADLVPSLRVPDRPVLYFRDRIAVAGEVVWVEKAFSLFAFG
ncbi:MAG: hypothetical protein M0000_06400, partial [Actinomycetota bacterium]|nr:hypothetical protein [Actinomycetota bacterium]